MPLLSVHSLPIWEQILISSIESESENSDLSVKTILHASLLSVAHHWRDCAVIDTRYLMTVRHYPTFVTIPD